MIRDKEYHRLWRQRQARKIKAIVDRYKLLKGCIDCGYKAHAAALEFDHIGVKKNNVGRLIYCGSLKTVRDEIALCEIVCANCHNIREHTRRSTVD